MRRPPRPQRKPQPYGTVPLAEVLAVAAAADEYDGLMSPERFRRFRADDAIDEQIAETAWLRHAESFNWQEEFAL